jgi:hypothetical protein
MAQIVLTEEQARLVDGAGSVEVRDNQGRVLGHVEPLGISAEEIAEMKRRAATSKEWYTGEQVRRHLKALEAAEKQRGSLSVSEAPELLDRIREQEA